MLPYVSLAITLVLACWSGTAWAQATARPSTEPAPRALTLLASGGYVAFADDGRLDHVMGGAGVERRWTSRLALAGEVSYMVGPGADRDLLVAAVLRAGILRWDGPVVPYGLVTGGVLAHADRVFGQRYVDVGMLLQVGGGVRIAGGRRWFLAPEFAIGGPPHVRATLTLGVALP